MIKKIFHRQRILTIIGFLLLLIGWQTVSIYMHELIVASPYEAIITLYKMVGTISFNEHFWVSLQRISIGIVLGGLSGFILGVIAGLYKDIKYLLEPLMWLLMSIPPIIAVVLAMLWFGMGSVMVIFIISTITAPIVYINTCKGINMVDDSLIEMAGIYQFGFFMKLKHIYIPSIISPLSASMVIITGSAAKMVVMAELLGANDGIGFAIADARSNLEIPELFAWILSIITIVGIFEFMVFKPIHNHLMRWRKNGQ